MSSKASNVKTKAVWVDTSSFSQGETDRTPRCWTLKVPWGRLTVHRHIRYEPDQWLLSCEGIGVDCYELKAKDADEAKREAIRFAKSRTRVYLAVLESADEG